MNNNPNIRPVNSEDIDLIKTIIDQNDLFPSELLDDMMIPYFNREEDRVLDNLFAR